MVRKSPPGLKRSEVSRVTVASSYPNLLECLGEDELGFLIGDGLGLSLYRLANVAFVASVWIDEHDTILLGLILASRHLAMMYCIMTRL